MINGGFIWLEAAENLQHRGLALTVVERASYLMPHIDSEMAAFLYQHLASRDEDVKHNTNVRRATPIAACL